MLNKNIQTGSEDEKSTNCERIIEFIKDVLMQFYRFFLSLMPKSGDEWQRRVAITATTRSNGKNSFEIMYEILFSVRLLFRGHLHLRSDLDLWLILVKYLGCENLKVEHL